MAKNPIEQRRKRYFQLSAQIAQMDHERMRALLGASESRAGWGRHQTVEVGGVPVFVKRIPVTDLEYDHPLSTRNLFQLPPHYNYGVGSAGMGVYRELVAHIKTTAWVLEGKIETFPLLYHSRIVPFCGERAELDQERHRRYVEYWGGDENIDRYLRERAEAKHEQILFLEHILQELHPWLMANSGRVDTVLAELFTTVDFLRKQGIRHLDAHFGNILTDGERPYLTDFGLVLDRSFDLAAEETAFWRAHPHYDYGEILACLGPVLFGLYEALPEGEKRQIEEKYGVREGMSYSERSAILVDRVEEIHADGVLKLDRRFVACMVRYRPIIVLMEGFFSAMSRNNQKDTPFRHTQLKRLLKAHGVVHASRA